MTKYSLFILNMLHTHYICDKEGSGSKEIHKLLCWFHDLIGVTPITPKQA